ncbi:unnamed protein product [Thelazia callipaeda]|uniref:B box-type domain-containing protein n=1 Tax=Thelazia callipaeda TaxID=103827 RepID=A0A0N5D7H3_THECL|nr:unnamed protein product [Thelazia callipaeda]
MGDGLDHQCKLCELTLISAACQNCFEIGSDNLRKNPDTRKHPDLHTRAGIHTDKHTHTHANGSTIRRDGHKQAAAQLLFLFFSALFHCTCFRFHNYLFVPLPDQCHSLCSPRDDLSPSNNQ